MKGFLKIAALTTALMMLLGVAGSALAYEALTGPTGVLKYNKEKSFQGYTLFSPMINSKTTYLIDMDGNLVHKWDRQYTPGLYAELLPNGNLLASGVIPPEKKLGYVGIGGAGGILQELDWNGKVVWEYKLFTVGKEIQHHTFCRMPNGNTLILAWEYLSKDEAVKLGRDPKSLPSEPVKAKGIPHDGFWMDFVREVDQAGKTVWEWHVKDHLGTGPDKLDFNYILPKPVGDLYHTYDWSHFNTVNYIPSSDTIVLNSRNLAEFYFVNHKTGAIEYRWGNPTTHDPKAKKPGWYDNGAVKVWGSHCATPLENGHVLLFDNGSEGPEARRSAAVEVDPKTSKVVWQFTSKHTNSFFSYRQGGVQRLPNGNTLICSTHGGHVFEVTPEKEVVWEFVNPFFSGEPRCVAGEESALPAEAHLNGMANMIHRAFRYGPDYPGLKGKDLTPQGYVAQGCPQFFKVYKKGVTLKAKSGEAATQKAQDDDEEEDGPSMHAY